MVTARHTHRDGQLGVILFHAHLAGPEQLKLQTAPQTGLVDVRQQGVHFRFAGQLLFKLRHILLNLLALLLQGIQTGCLREFFCEIPPELGFLLARRSQLFIRGAQPYKPEADNDKHSHRCA
ncbi:hypothetical protein D9M73_85170 [compost metagenome]